MTEFAYCPEDGPKESVVGITTRRIDEKNFMAAMIVDRLGVYLVFNGPDSEELSTKYDKYRSKIYQLAEDSGNEAGEPDDTAYNPNADEDLDSWLDGFLIDLQ